MSKFKVGDRVRRINLRNDNIRPGHTGTIASVEDHNYAYVNWDNSTQDHGNSTWHLELLSSPEEKEEGLVEGMAVECTPAMRKAIVELAKELGVFCDHASDRYNAPGHVGLYWFSGKEELCAYVGHDDKAIPEHEFIRRLRITAEELASRPKPIRVTYDNKEWEAKPEKGFVRFGTCTKIPNETIRELNKVLID
jgi:hypothetical protein